ncbi:hypothetical protein SAMN05443633_11511 [Chryseobacterium arachidis]|uniref:Uncharacterized protein n=1 Tax=Chryseobacterium arachidis TaxID=1416778 RepID=A0A1M5JLT5_9FLAO|nr:hypothetical protein SAMN05443633_11511 [Chryseobacterium arachidis]
MNTYQLLFKITKTIDILGLIYLLTDNPNGIVFAFVFA